jgi:biopolymer transport protein ExbD
MMRRIGERVGKKAELQVAPLIDVVFLLLIYFMVTASLVKREAEISFALPGTEGRVELPLEVLIEVTEPGDVFIEGMRFESMKDLAEQLASLKMSADFSGSELVVNILPADRARHGRVVAVMGACSAADVQTMSFGISM